MRPPPDSDGPLRCLCAAARRTARLLTRCYEEALRPAGITVSQFELMMTLRAAGPVDQAALARITEIDQTTLSRNLKLLLAEGWIDRAKGRRDARRRAYRINAAGLRTLEQASALWRGVQEEIEDSLGAPVSQVLSALERIQDAARDLTG